MAWIEEEHPAIKPKQAAKIGQFCDRRRAANHRNRANARRHRPRSRKSIGGTTGNAQDPKFSVPQFIGDLAEQRQPVEQLPFRMK